MHVSVQHELGIENIVDEFLRDDEKYIGENNNYWSLKNQHAMQYC